MNLKLFAIFVTVQMAGADLFASKIFSNIATSKSTDNIILSPLSIQTCLTSALLGADGTTGTELSTGLYLGTSDITEIASKFSNLIKSLNNSTNLHLANRVFVNKNYQLNPDYQIAIKSALSATAENLNFNDATGSAKYINSWVADVTNNKIQNLVAPDNITPAAILILINALHFNASWDNEFHVLNDPISFSTSLTPINMMEVTNQFNYGVFDDLDATAVEINYIDSDFSMMVILPNQIDGLQRLENQLQSVDFINDISKKMERKKVHITMPKFNIEFSLSLNEILKQMGMNRMFSASTDFHNMFQSLIPVQISDVLHKAVINVDEHGTEASAATLVKAVFTSASFGKPTEFLVDHPFVFLIKDSNFVYFVGHIVNV